MKTESILYVQNQRQLPDGRLVVSGPSFGRRGPHAVFQWGAGEKGPVQLLDPFDPARIVAAELSCSAPEVLGSDEIFGFDPFSTDYPALREFQNYTSAMISALKQSENLLGLVMLPANVSAHFIHCRMRLIFDGLDQESSLMQEVAQTQVEERIILRWESSLYDGFLLIPAKCVASGASLDCEGTLILPVENGSDITGRLVYLKPYRQAGTRSTQYREISVGNCLPLSSAPVPIS